MNKKRLPIPNGIEVDPSKYDLTLYYVDNPGRYLLDENGNFVTSTLAEYDKLNKPMFRAVVTAKPNSGYTDAAASTIFPQVRPTFLVTIPAGIELTSTQTTQMKLEFIGDGEAMLSTSESDKYSVYVYLTEINDTDIGSYNKNYFKLSDDHAADTVNYDLTVTNRDGVPFSPLDYKDSEILKGGYYKDYTQVLMEDTAKLEFEVDSSALDNAFGEYKGSLTFTIITSNLVCPFYDYYFEKRSDLWIRMQDRRATRIIPKDDIIVGPVVR